MRKNGDAYFGNTKNSPYLCSGIIKNKIMIKAIKNRTREEVIAAFRQSIQRKQEWQKKAEEEIKKIRMERMELSV